jgi:hypothetical protein
MWSAEGRAQTCPFISRGAPNGDAGVTYQVNVTNHGASPILDNHVSDQLASPGRWSTSVAFGVMTGNV